MPKFNEDIAFIDLFAGIGGFRIALESHGAHCVFSSEFDKACQITYEANFGEKPSGDITKIQAEEIPPFDIICGGFPCQPFSVSGLQKGFEDSRGTLFFDIARIVEHHKPRIVFLENVANLSKHSDGQTIQRMKTVLDGLGYDVNLQVLNASNYGVPQARKRLYFMCFRKDLGVTDYHFPEPTLDDIALEDVLLPDDETNDFVIKKGNIVMIREDITERVLKPVRIGTIDKGGQGNRVYSAKGHAITLSAHGGGLGAKTGTYLVNGRVRKLAPEECRRVQGFPDGFKIPGSNSVVWTQMGNSVSVPVLKKIIAEVVKLPQLDGVMTHS